MCSGEWVTVRCCQLLCAVVCVIVLRSDAEVMSMFAALINKLKGAMEGEVPRVFEAVFEVTLQARGALGGKGDGQRLHPLHTPIGWLPMKCTLGYLL